MKFWNRNANAGTPSTGASDEAAAESTSVVGEILGSDLGTPFMNVRSSGDSRAEDVEMGQTGNVTGGTRTGNDR